MNMDRDLLAYGTIFGPVQRLDNAADKPELIHTFPD